jgi:hypothetical protein
VSSGPPWFPFRILHVKVIPLERCSVRVCTRARCWHRNEPALRLKEEEPCPIFNDFLLRRV